MFVDLHLHSVGSDGLSTPKELVKVLTDENVQIFAITDHESLDSVSKLKVYAKEANIGFIPGIEITVQSESTIHIVGLGVDPLNEKLSKLCKESKMRIIQRVHKIMIILKENHIRYDLEELKQSKGRLDDESLLKLLVDASDKDIMNAKNLLSVIRDADKKRHPDLRSAIELIHQSGGLAILAHPFRGDKNVEQVMREFDQCLRYGIDGIECFYPGCSNSDREIIVSFCHANNLFLSGGSDWHGRKPYPLEKISSMQLMNAAGDKLIKLIENTKKSTGGYEHA